MYILHTVLYTFPKVLTWRICLILNKETTTFSLQDMFRHSYVDMPYDMMPYDMPYQSQSLIPRKQKVCEHSKVCANTISS